MSAPGQTQKGKGKKKMKERTKGTKLHVLVKGYPPSNADPRFPKLDNDETPMCRCVVWLSGPAKALPQIVACVLVLTAVISAGLEYDMTK